MIASATQHDWSEMVGDFALQRVSAYAHSLMTRRWSGWKEAAAWKNVLTVAWSRTGSLAASAEGVEAPAPVTAPDPCCRHLVQHSWHWSLSIGCRRSCRWSLRAAALSHRAPQSRTCFVIDMGNDICRGKSRAEASTARARHLMELRKWKTSTPSAQQRREEVAMDEASRHQGIKATTHPDIKASRQPR